MTATKTTLPDAALIDFTGSVDGFRHLKQFGPEFVALVRARSDPGRPASLIVIDRAVQMPLAGPVVVRDHLNLTGSNPLIGPNDALGERFPVVQGIYITDLDLLPELPQVLVAGLKSGITLSYDDAELLKRFGVNACCYNTVAAMLIAAHARCRMLAILLPEGQQLPSPVLSRIQQLTGAYR